MKQPTDQQERNEDKKKPEKENPSHGIDPESKDPEMEVDQDPGERQKENQNQKNDDPLAAWAAEGRVAPPLEAQSGLVPLLQLWKRSLQNLLLLQRAETLQWLELLGWEQPFQFWVRLLLHCFGLV
jgi:hypothetical protein